MPEATSGDGTMRNARGQDIPVRMVKEVARLRDEVVMQTVRSYERLHGELALAKKQIVQDVEAFLALSAERFGEDLGGKKGHVTLYSYDGKYKVVRSITDNMVFDEGLDAAKELIDQYLSDVMRDAPGEARMLVEKAFRPNAAGRISTSAVLSLRSLSINDPRWITAMHAISESLQVMSSKAYVRVYRKDAQENWQPISVDFAAL